MKLLFFIGAMNGGGAQRVMANLTNGLLKKGHEVYLAYDMNQNCSFDLDSRIICINSREGCVPNVWYKKTHLYRRSRYLLNIRKIARRIQPDIAISFMTNVNADVILMLKGLNIPIIVSEHTNISRDRGRKISFIHKKLYPLAKAVTLLTQYDCDYWSGEYKNIEYMPNPSDSKKIHHNQERRNVVISAGRVTDWETKGFDNLIRAWAIIEKNHPDWRLQIIGAGRDCDFEYLKGLAKEVVAKNVDFLGFRKDIQEIMSASAIYCLSSRHEGLPMVLIEAMNAGCCCVSFDCKTGPREIIDDNISGLLVRDQDVSDLVDKLTKVIENASLRNLLAKNAPSSVERYSTAKILEKWELLFEKVLKK